MPRWERMKEERQITTRLFNKVSRNLVIFYFLKITHIIHLSVCIHTYKYTHTRESIKKGMTLGPTVLPYMNHKLTKIPAPGMQNLLQAGWLL